MFELQPFLDRCDAYLAASGRSEVWLSKKLFSQRTFKLGELRAGKCGVTLRSFGVAVDLLTALEREAEAEEAAMAAAGASSGKTDQTVSQ